MKDTIALLKSPLLPSLPLKTRKKLYANVKSDMYVLVNADEDLFRVCIILNKHMKTDGEKELLPFH